MSDDDRYLARTVGAAYMLGILLQFINNNVVAAYVAENDGLLSAQTFVYQSGKLQSYYIGIRWREGGEPEIIGTSLPEVTKIKENDDGSFKYLGNKILNDGIKDIPEYQYRFNKG